MGLPEAVWKLYLAESGLRSISSMNMEPSLLILFLIYIPCFPDSSFGFIQPELQLVISAMWRPFNFPYSYSFWSFGV